MELQALSDSMNAMAERLIHGQDLLSDNVRSLEDTNKELVLARDQVIRSARLASVGTLAAGLAHEVGNPLGAIMAYLDAARSRVGSDAEVADVLDATMKEAKRIDRIIRSLLDYARPRSDVDGPADPLQVVQRVRSLLDAQGRFEGVNVRWDMPLELGSVLLDPHHLEQVLVNLLLNAVDALKVHPDPRPGGDAAGDTGHRAQGTGPSGRRPARDQLRTPATRAPRGSAVARTAAAGGGACGRAPRAGQRPGSRARGPRTPLRPILHDEAAGEGHGAGAGGLRAPRRGDGGEHRSTERSGRWRLR